MGFWIVRWRNKRKRGQQVEIGVVQEVRLPFLNQSLDQAKGQVEEVVVDQVEEEEEVVS